MTNSKTFDEVKQIQIGSIDGIPILTSDSMLVPYRMPKRITTLTLTQRIQVLNSMSLSFTVKYLLAENLVVFVQSEEKRPYTGFSASSLTNIFKLRELQRCSPQQFTSQYNSWLEINEWNLQAYTAIALAMGNEKWT